jgi:hypothetical protein
VLISNEHFLSTPSNVLFAMAAEQGCVAFTFALIYAFLFFSGAVFKCSFVICGK